MLECFDGLIVRSNGKEGYIRDRGNPMGFPYMKCIYDSLVPITNRSTFPNGKIGLSPLLFEVCIDGKWGIRTPDCYFELYRTVFGAVNIPCEYDSVMLVNNFPAVAIVRRSVLISFLNIDTKKEFGKYKEVFHVVANSSNVNNQGIYYACIHKWDEVSGCIVDGCTLMKSKADIFDVTQWKVVDREDFHWCVTKIEGINWRKA
jgi:hypothetical protein